MDRSPVIWQSRKSSVITELKADIGMTDGFGRCDVYAAAEFSDYYSDSSVLRNRFGLRHSGQSTVKERVRNLSAQSILSSASDWRQRA